MRQCSDATVVREQASIFYFSPGQSDEMPKSLIELYTHMFIEDLSRALLPVWTTRDGSKISVELTPPNSDLRGKLSAAFNISRQDYYDRDLVRVLSEFLRLTMVELCIDRRMVFEIAYLRPKPEEPRDAFKLFHINSRQIVHRWGRWYQIVPPDIARDRQVAESISLPCENISVFTLPDHLARPIASAMEALSALSDDRWHGLAIQAQEENIPYDFSVHQRSMNLALAESVREIGWTARGLFNQQITNYYSLRQNLRFKLFALGVREALLAQLNAVLKRVGPALGCSTQLSISGLPTRSNLEEALAELASGEKPFTEIMDEIRNL